MSKCFFVFCQTLIPEIWWILILVCFKLGPWKRHHHDDGSTTPEATSMISIQQSHFWVITINIQELRDSHHCGSFWKLHINHWRGLGYYWSTSALLGKEVLVDIRVLVLVHRVLPHKVMSKRWLHWVSQKRRRATQQAQSVNTKLTNI